MEALLSGKPAKEMVTVAINFTIATGRLKDKRKEREESEESNNEQSDVGMKRSARGQRRRQTVHHATTTTITGQPASGLPRLYRRCMTFDNRNITHGSGQPLSL